MSTTTKYSGIYRVYNYSQLKNVRDSVQNIKCEGGITRSFEDLAREINRRKSPQEAAITKDVIFRLSKIGTDKGSASNQILLNLPMLTYALSHYTKEDLIEIALGQPPVTPLARQLHGIDPSVASRNLNVPEPNNNDFKPDRSLSHQKLLEIMQSVKQLYYYLTEYDSAIKQELENIKQLVAQLTRSHATEGDETTELSNEVANQLKIKLIEGMMNNVRSILLSSSADGTADISSASTKPQANSHYLSVNATNGTN